MIAIVILVFLLGVTMTAIASHLIHNHRIRTMKADVLVALAAQATDSYRAGYMRAMINQTTEQKKKNKDRQTLITATN